MTCVHLILQLAIFYCITNQGTQFDPGRDKSCLFQMSLVVCRSVYSGAIPYLPLLCLCIYWHWYFSGVQVVVLLKYHGCSFPIISRRHCLIQTSQCCSSWNLSAPVSAKFSEPHILQLCGVTQTNTNTSFFLDFE